MAGATKTIKVLFDSVHDNTGDRAVGAALLVFAASRGAEIESLNPLRPSNLKAGQPVVIGGGELIHAPGDPFYDAFRIEGPHILNTVGLASGVGLEFLEQYEYVSVRSSLDRSLVDSVRPDAVVVPCISTDLEPSEPPEELSPNTVLAHVHSNMAHHIPTIAGVLEELSGSYEIKWISLTPYAGDRATMLRLGATMSNPPVVVDRAAGPRQKIAVISKAKLLICASLHGAIFAHANNVPFVVYAQPPKVRAFLEDRGLEYLGFTDEASLRLALEKALSGSLDFSHSIEQDKKRLTEHKERLAELLHLPPPKKRKGDISIDPKKLYHTTEAARFDAVALNQAYREMEALALKTASLAHLQKEIAALREHAAFLEEELKAHREELKKWRQIAKDYEADRDRWKERGLAAEAALTQERARNEMLGHLNHSLAQIAEALKASAGNRHPLTERLIKHSKRAGKAAMARLPEKVREPSRRLVEKALGRPVELPSINSTASRLPISGTAARAPSASKEGHSEPAAKGRGGREDREAGKAGAHGKVTAAYSSPRDGQLGPVAVLIPTLNAGYDFETTLRAIRCQQGVDLAEIVILDSGSRDGTTRSAKAHGARIATIPAKEFNHGRARNRLVSLCSSPYLVFMTQDAIPASPETIRRLLEMLLSDRQIAAVSARQVPRSDSDLFGAYTVFSHAKLLCLERDALFPDDGPVDRQTLERVDATTLRRWVSVDNVCAAYRREILEAQPFAELDFAEDLDFGLRAIEAGLRVGYCHSAVVVHSHDRPALYHAKRHVADRIFVATRLQVAGNAEAAPGALANAPLASILASCAIVLVLVEETSIGGSMRPLPTRIQELQETLESARQLAPYRGEELLRHDAKIVQSMDGGSPGVCHPEIGSLLKWILEDLASLVPDGRVPDRRDGRGTGKSLDGFALGTTELELVRLFSEHTIGMLQSPPLAEFVSANAWASSSDAATFVARLMGAASGSFLGEALRQLPEAMSREVLRGV